MKIYLYRCVVVEQMTLMNRHQLIASSRIDHIEICQRDVRRNRSLVKTLSLNKTLINILGHLRHVIIRHGDEAILSTKALMDRAICISCCISNDFAILGI